MRRKTYPAAVRAGDSIQRQRLVRDGLRAKVEVRRCRQVRRRIGWRSRRKARCSRRGFPCQEQAFRFQDFRKQIKSTELGFVAVEELCASWLPGVSMDWSCRAEGLGRPATSDKLFLRPCAQQSPHQDKLAHVVSIVVCDQQRLTKDRLPIAMRNGGIKIGLWAGNKILHFLEVAPKRFDRI